MGESVPTIPVDYQADVLRIDLAHEGHTRVILLGDEADMAPGGLRTALARWGVQVLIPPESERAWIASLGETLSPTASDEDVAHLRALLADGVEHGVKAIVCANERLADAVRACDLAVPTVAYKSHGSIVPIRNIVFDMGGVLFRWDPLAMARRVCGVEEDAQLLARVVFGSSEWVSQDAGALDDQTVAWTAKTRVPGRLHASVDELVFHWHDHRIAIDGMEELIRDLKAAGYGIYLLSNAGESFAQYEEQLPARSCFDGTVVSCYEHVVKPDERIYRALLERFGLEAGECLFIDDARINVLGARRVGMRSLQFAENPEVIRALLLG